MDTSKCRWEVLCEIWKHLQKVYTERASIQKLVKEHFLGSLELILPQISFTLLTTPAVTNAIVTCM